MKILKKIKTNKSSIKLDRKKKLINLIILIITILLNILSVLFGLVDIIAKEYKTVSLIMVSGISKNISSNRPYLNFIGDITIKYLSLSIVTFSSNKFR